MTLFSYKTGQTLAHDLDVRVKCALVCLLSVGLLNTGLLGILICLGFLVFYLKKLNHTLKDLVRRLFFFLFFLILILLSRWATLPGEAMFTLLGITLTWQGLISGGQMALRFLCIMLLGLIFTATTRSGDIKAAAQWFLGPVPFVPEKRAAIMISLALRFFPLILHQAMEISHAVNARCGNLEKNPVKRMVHLTWPLLKKVFSSADNLSLAMEARCYCEDRSDPEFSQSGKEGWVSALALVFSAGLILVNCL